MEELKNHVIRRINEELKNRKWSKKYFGETILGKSESWLHNKLQKRRKMTFGDLELMAKGLGIASQELCPSHIEYDIDKMSLRELIETITEEKIEEVLKENGIIANNKKEG